MVNVQELCVNGRGGNDNINGSVGLAGLIHLTLNGGRGKDTIIGGDGPDAIDGGADDDDVNGAGGDDTITVYAGQGSDQVNGGFGFDTFVAIGIPGPNTFAISPINIVIDGVATSYVNIDVLNAFGCESSDTFDVSPSHFTQINVDGGPGFDTLIYHCPGVPCQQVGNCITAPTYMNVCFFNIENVQIVYAAADVTNCVQVVKSGIVKSGGLYLQRVTLTNVCPTAIRGKVSLVLDNLTPGVQAANDGFTQQSLPAGSPFVNVNIGPDNVLSPGESAVVTLQFSNPSNGPINWTPRVLAGPNPR